MGEIVKLIEIGNGIVQVVMEDRLAKNTFSPELISGLKTTFDQINKNNEYKVVVINGYENYFCCGGTKEELLAIYKGELKFTDLDFFKLLLECELPVIAAMQGHALGGGLVFGLYADFIILGNENVYATNFMKYGFTPGMGATYIVPYKFGNVIGPELLFSAENYRGSELKERGVQLKVVSKSNVIPEAIQLAQSLADKPRNSLIVLKDQMTEQIKSGLVDTIQKELIMHEKTFHNDEVAQRIEGLF